MQQASMYHILFYNLSNYIAVHLKKRTSRVSKQGNKDKIQLNIKKYLHNIHSKDQDPKVMNKLRVEEDTDVKRCTNESSVATYRIAGEMLETQTNCRNNGRTFKLLPVNILNL